MSAVARRLGHDLVHRATVEVSLAAEDRRQCNDCKRGGVERPTDTVLQVETPELLLPEPHGT
jgi:hypothetical protein